jgi:hypothetical protein
MPGQKTVRWVTEPDVLTATDYRDAVGLSRSVDLRRKEKFRFILIRRGPSMRSLRRKQLRRCHGLRFLQPLLSGGERRIRSVLTEGQGKASNVGELDDRSRRET